MSYDCTDFADTVVGVLTLKGYTVHAGDDDGNICELTDGSHFWWKRETASTISIGEKRDTELEAWGSALCDALEPSKQAPKDPAL
jgi:hypothetical protein